MAKVKIYSYKKCSTCVNALKFLDKKRVSAEVIDITEQAPTKSELEKMLGFYDGDLKKLFNTSGVAYRENSIKDKLPQMTKSQVLSMLSKNGRLVKRPFLLTGKSGLVGFKEDQWKKVL